MKLLLDENLSRRIIPFLEADFPGSTHVALIGLERATDVDIWQYARDNKFCIVTKDADFYELSLVSDMPPKVIWLKIGNVTRSAVVSLLLNNKNLIEDMLMAEDTTCVQLY
jgi:predicted nuclease of predicted toxin-antitoxin system